MNKPIKKSKNVEMGCKNCGTMYSAKPANIEEEGNVPYWLMKFKNTDDVVMLNSNFEQFILGWNSPFFPVNYDKEKYDVYCADCFAGLIEHGVFNLK